jgi:metallopeptidase MepB
MSLPQPLPCVLATEDVVPAMRAIVDKYNIIRSRTLETVTPETATFNTVLKPLAEVENEVQGTFAMIEMLQYGSPSLKTQAEYDKARELYAKAQETWIADGHFFKLLQAARENVNFNQLDAESKHFLEKELLRYKHAGHGLLGPAQLEEFQKCNSEILELEREFHQNVARENGGIWLTLDELDGLPETDLAKWKDASETEEVVNSSDQKEKTKKKFVPFANGGTIAVLTYANRPETRKKMYLADNLKLGENKPIFEKIVTNRARQAHLLNYPTYADLKLTERMAKSTTWLKTFLQGLKTSLCPLGKAEIEVLQRRRLSHLQARGYTINPKTDHKFPPWDKRYYERLVEQDFEMDKEKIAEYFPLDTTATKMLDLFGSWLGIRFDLIPDDMLTEDVIWHDTIRAFSVWDTEDGGFVGYLYFDLLWREYKFRGNQCVNLQAVRQLCYGFLTLLCRIQ